MTRSSYKPGQKTVAQNLLQYFVASCLLPLPERRQKFTKSPRELLLFQEEVQKKKQGGPAKRRTSTTKVSY